MSQIIHIETLSTGQTFSMHLIAGGNFDMGSTDDDKNALDDEKPQRINVKIDSFYLAPYIVTQMLWQSVMGENKNLSRFKGDKRPVENVSWLDTQEFIKALNEQTQTNRLQAGLSEYRLPTEAEWEYAARGGPFNSGYQYAGSDKLKEVCWYKDNSDNETHEVGLLMPNQLGLYDMSGNVWEWVEDHWHNNYNDALNDSHAWLDTNNKHASRVVRGGSSFGVSQRCRVAYRDSNAPDSRGDGIGFRLALSPSLGQSTLAIL